MSGDPTSSQQDEQLPSYNAYSIDGDVTAPLVYVNYGAQDDYKELERLGVSVKGAIVIARYGQTWRGIKPKLAAEHGALGCIIYSDPRDDGYAQGETYPAGPFRPPDGVQRGSVMDMPVYPGDPLTPGVGATKDAKRLKLSEVTTLTKIPTLPISYADAQPLLAALTGPVAPENWRGALPITYRVGPGAAKVHLKVSFNWDTKTLYDVIARIPGSTYPDEWIIRGNHHDAWVNGAEDPIAGTVALLEEARGLGTLLRQGWRPKRTIIYCVWDGEEEALLGSTEWAEDHAEELQRKAAVYINTDGNGRGFLNMSGSHTLEKFINGVARDVKDPETGLTVWKRLQMRRIEARVGLRHNLAPAGSPGSAPACRSAHRSAGVRLGLFGFHRSSGSRVAEPGLWRRGRRRHLSFGLRRFQLVHAFRRYRFQLRARAVGNCRAGRAAPGRRGNHSFRFHRFHRYHPALRGRNRAPGPNPARRHPGTQSRDRRRACSRPPTIPVIRWSRRPKIPCLRS